MRQPNKKAAPCAKEYKDITPVSQVSRESTSRTDSAAAGITRDRA